MTNRETLVKYFKSGEKRGKTIGVEFEHFLVDSETLRSYSYFEDNGQKSLSETLESKGWALDYVEKGHILNASKDGNTFSLEPGGQVEISIKPIENIFEIEREYLAVKAEIEEALSKNQALISLGYHPVSKILDLELLPKKRYHLMYDYLHEKGTMARNMMKGTASTQVSIDYRDEEDFSKKFRAAHFLSPFISRLFDASPIFEGEVFNDKSLRMKIWDNTDPSRCKFPDHMFDQRFDYGAYADYVLNTSPVFFMVNNEFKRVDHLTVNQIAAKEQLSIEQLVHATTMVFPDVRLKQFLEIRMADAVPYPFNLAVPALIKGIFYDAENLDKYHQMSLSFNDQEMKSIHNKMLKSYHFEFMYNDQRVSSSAFIKTLMNDAIKGLDENEQSFLVSFSKWIDENVSVAVYLKALYTHQFDQFKSFILRGGQDV